MLQWYPFVGGPMTILLPEITVSVARDWVDYTLASVAVVNFLVLTCTLYAVFRYTKKR